MTHKTIGVVSIGAHEPNVEIDFTATPLDPAILDNVQFTSEVNQANVPTYQWNLDDSKTSALANPSGSYQTAGLKDISLTVFDIDGRIATVTKPGYINVRDYELGITAIPETGEAPLAVAFASTFEREP